MRDQGPGRTAEYQSEATRGSARQSGAAGRDEVLYDIGVAIAAFLGLAVLAQLAVLMIQAG